MRTSRRATALLFVIGLVALLVPLPAVAEAPANNAFTALWQRTDLPVAVDHIHRSWIWGDPASATPVVESYDGAPGGVRVVQYYDKGRMEITHPQADPNAPGYVTSGLLTRELISGRMQVGDDTFDDTHQPAKVPLAGDDTNTFPTYADLGSWIDQGAPDRTGEQIDTALAPDGASTYAAARQDDGARAAHYVTYTAGTGEEIGFNIPAAFWTYMNQDGPIYQNGELTDASPLFDWRFVMGLPIGEAFWSQVTLAGRPTWVMIQPFERRVLTYTPSNPDGWQVEMGNIGQHYHTWRYHLLAKQTAPATIELGDFYYSPQTLTIPAGTKVVWTVSAQQPNTVTADDGSWDSGILNHGAIFAHQFNTPGTYHYHSRYYVWMHGTIIVTEAGP
ncbi:MAG TPA: cupredoxin domain-containing protein [Nitrolancea sp.]|nr:cupredoxin domain-containing protein [Nitrolancea sp.]